MSSGYNQFQTVTNWVAKTTDAYFLTTLETRNPRSKCWPSCTPSSKDSGDPLLASLLASGGLSHPLAYSHTTPNLLFFCKIPLYLSFIRTHRQGGFVCVCMCVAACLPGDRTGDKPQGLTQLGLTTKLLSYISSPVKRHDCI